MIIVKGIERMQRLALKARREGRCIGFVPTMGALHDGHLSLIKRSRRDNDLVVVSIFVNPAQFGKSEDFKRYPRNFSEDRELCRKAGVDIIFFPPASQVYPHGYRTYCNVDGLGDILCGRFRPGHFRGVATVVLKLFNIVQPDRAYFGQKDAQQLALIRRMAKDLNLALKIVALPTLRSKDGLALSSRNMYLSPKQRKDALAIFQALKLAKKLASSNSLQDPQAVIRRMQDFLRKKKAIRLDYIAIVDADDLSGLKRMRRGSLVALAARLGKTRLIDNIII